MAEEAMGSVGKRKVVLVKIGGSSITDKSKLETIDKQALDWFSKIISRTISQSYLYEDKDETAKDIVVPNLAFIIVHGAGSFGHFSAKKFGLKGQTLNPDLASVPTSVENRYIKRGLAETRLSVQTLNKLVVSSLLEQGVNAVGISPAFGIPGLEAHASLQLQARQHMEDLVFQTINAGLVPVLHGDACLYGHGAGILSGDTILEILGTKKWVDESIFITDVDGVFSEDPRSNPDATLLRKILVDPDTKRITTTGLNASTSSHDHDVTGGLETKLKSAAVIAATGKSVSIVRCQSPSAEQALSGMDNVEICSIISPQK